MIIEMKILGAGFEFTRHEFLLVLEVDWKAVLYTLNKLGKIQKVGYRIVHESIYNTNYRGRQQKICNIVKRSFLCISKFRLYFLPFFKRIQQNICVHSDLFFL